jgi:hypothetical protein
MGAFDAGYLVAKNNKDLMTRAVPVAEGIIKTIDNGSTPEVVSAIFREALNKMLGEIDPVIAANITYVLSQVKFDVGKDKYPVLSNEIIKGLVEAFLNGAKVA